MKNLITLIICMVCVFSFVACDNQSSKSDTSDKITVQTWIDYYSSDMPWDEGFDIELQEFPNVTFLWESDKVTAQTEDASTTLIEGLPIWNVFFCDITGDNKPELCATISYGSGIVDDRIVIIDYLNNKSYELSARMEYDYYLSNQEDKLMVIRTPYNKNENDENTIVGTLSFTDEQLIVKYSTGETEILIEMSQS